ncbi:hypothetical protein [Streptomyces sp. 2A115]|uniref:hypothetical protein n=1 Tax=Streptomyces sp. 2A115 TaxID=3457439 RepID=UPI003FD1A39A
MLLNGPDSSDGRRPEEGNAGGLIQLHSGKDKKTDDGPVDVGWSASRRSRRS